MAILGCRRCTTPQQTMLLLRHRLLPILLFIAVGFVRPSSCATDSNDTAVLWALMAEWENEPPSWGSSGDPCASPGWDGVDCNDATRTRVTEIKLSTMGLGGTLASDIGQLAELQFIDLSYNDQLGGPLPQSIGNLKKLNTLILVGCSFTGTIPDELGQLTELRYLSLNSNMFSGRVPASLGNLVKLYWLDIGNNQLTGPIPVSSSNSSSAGLNRLINTKHFHFNKNQLSGSIPDALFGPSMTLIHLLLDGNQFTGSIPGSLGLVQTLEVVRLDRNTLTGPVPSNLNNLTRVNELSLADNELTGPIPDLSGMNSLNYVDLSNNTFDPSVSPAWFSKLPSLTALIAQSVRLYGPVPTKLFAAPQLQEVTLDDNGFNGTLDMGDYISSELSIVSFQDNDLSAVVLTNNYNGTLMLSGNPVCDKMRSSPCNRALSAGPPYSTSLAKCYSAPPCPADQSMSPQSCSCAYPYQGIMFFRAPRLRDVSNVTIFQQLEMSLWTKLGLAPGSVLLQGVAFDSEAYLQVSLKLFPSKGLYFNRSEIIRIGFDLSNQTYKPPPIFGPFYFIASPYPFPELRVSAIASWLIVDIAVGCSILIVALIGASAYAIRQRRLAREAIERNQPFASWPRSEESGGAPPKLKGARCFSYDELRRSTDNFSEANAIGSGGYGKVYRGVLPEGQSIAIKRARQGSMQGGLEFKTEIELLSRVHHKNLVALVGFCFDQGEQMLVYEFVPNGSLRESLAGGSGGVALDWRRRLRVALGAASGLAYLHELADPPIIHRDVKSNNILLDENLNAKVADFGLGKLVSDSFAGDAGGYITTHVKGTLGYLDPEYYMSQKLTQKSDVYSFGVVMLELVTARLPIERGNYIVQEVRQALDPNDELCGLKNLIDPRIAGGPLVALGQFVQLALRCVEDTQTARPMMSEVVKGIEAAMLIEGVDTSSNSVASLAMDLSVVVAGSNRNPYDDLVIHHRNGGSSSGRGDDSGGYAVEAKVDPK